MRHGDGPEEPEKFPVRTGMAYTHFSQKAMLHKELPGSGVDRYQLLRGKCTNHEQSQNVRRTGRVPEDRKNRGQKLKKPNHFEWLGLY